MLEKKNLPPEEINEKLSHKNWSRPLTGFVDHVEGTKIHFHINIMKGTTRRFIDKYWSHVQCNFMDGYHAGKSCHVNRSYPFDSSVQREIIIDLNTDGLDLSKLNSGDTITLRWDLSKLPASYWVKPYIVGANMNADLPGCKQIPRDSTNTFCRCALDNQEMPVGATVADCDGVVYEKDRHYLEMNNGMLYPVSKASNYVDATGDSIHKEEMIAEGLDPSKEAIPATKQENVMEVTLRNKRYAEKSKEPTYLNGQGVEMENEEYNIVEG